MSGRIVRRSMAAGLLLLVLALVLPPFVNLNRFRAQITGYSASDIKDICQSVQLRVVNELFESGKAMDSSANPRPIVGVDFKEILKIRKPSVSVDMIRAYMRWSDQFKAL